MTINLGTPIKTNLKPELYAITPEIAAQLLRNTEDNPRNATKGVYYRYAEDMRLGLWQSGGVDMIAIDRNGCLINGQNRMRAVVVSETTQEFWVIQDVEPDYCDNTDSGKKRRLKDYINIRTKQKNCGVTDIFETLLPRMYTFIYGSDSLGHVMNARGHRNVSVSRSQALSVLEESFDEMFYYATRAKSICKTHFENKSRGYVATALMFINKLGQSDRLDEFCHQMDAITTKHPAIIETWARLRTVQEPARAMDIDVQKYVIFTILAAYELFLQDDTNMSPRQIANSMNNLGDVAYKYDRLFMMKYNDGAVNPNSFALKMKAQLRN